MQTTSVDITYLYFLHLFEIILKCAASIPWWISDQTAQLNSLVGVSDCVIVRKSLSDSTSIHPNSIEVLPGCVTIFELQVGRIDFPAPCI